MTQMIGMLDTKAFLAIMRIRWLLQSSVYQNPVWNANLFCVIRKIHGDIRSGKVIIQIYLTYNQEMLLLIRSQETWDIGLNGRALFLSHHLPNLHQQSKKTLRFFAH